MVLKKDDYDDYDPYDNYDDESDGLGEYDAFMKQSKRVFRRKPLGKYLILLLIVLGLCAASGVAGYQLGYHSIYGEGYQDGHDAGYEEGRDLGYHDGLGLGENDGFDLGYKEGGEAAKNDVYYGIYGGETEAASASGDVVYLTAAGSCYHHEGCSYIAGKSNLRTMTESEAIANGYSPCSRCGK